MCRLSPKFRSPTLFETCTMAGRTLFGIATMGGRAKFAASAMAARFGEVPTNARMAARMAMILSLTLGAGKAACAAAAEDPRVDPQTTTATNGTMLDMEPMRGHMHMTSLRPPMAGDQQKAAAVATAARTAMAPYQDYRKALADGYEIFLPNVPQPQYHFTKYEYGLAARSSFDPLKPTSLLYTKTADGGYKLIGAMYTDRVDASEDELNERIPLSIARWHQHINFCKAPPDQKAAYFGPDAKFGLLGSITTPEACEAAGGVFHPHLFGWMVHVYPYETDPRKIWSTVDDDQGHDNMDHSVMPGMKMH